MQRNGDFWSNCKTKRIALWGEEGGGGGGLIFLRFCIFNISYISIQTLIYNDNDKVMLMGFGRDDISMCCLLFGIFGHVGFIHGWL